MRISDWSSGVCSSDLRKLGLSGNNIRSITDDICKYDINFNTDVAASDRFSVVVEQTWREGEMIKSGPILAATFTAHGDMHSGFRFERGGKAEYFSADGRPLKKAFIRMPVQYTRISSRFTSARKRSEEHTSEIQSLMRISYAVLGLKKNRQSNTKINTNQLRTTNTA